MTLATLLRARPDKQILADEGSYFVATNPTPGTAIAFAVNAAVSETAGYFLSVQNSQPANGKRIYLDYLRLICGVAPVSATAGDMFIKLDSSGWTSGGTAITPVNPNYDNAATSVATVNAGALKTAARVAPRLVARARLRTAIPVVGDEWDFIFGAYEHATAQVFNGTNPQRMPIGLPPVIIAPQAFALVQLWFVGNLTTPASFEFELGMVER